MTIRNTLALCAIAISMILTGCFAHGTRAVGESYDLISNAKDRDHALTHSSVENTTIRKKKEEYLDKYATCIEKHGGRSEPCQGFADLVDHYNAVTSPRMMSGMDPYVEAIVYENLAIGRWEDWGQNETINRHEREIGSNSRKIGLIRKEIVYIYDSLDRIEEEYREWDEVFDEANGADLDDMLDELDELRAYIDSVNGGSSATGNELMVRISRMERELKTLKGVN